MELFKPLLTLSPILFSFVAALFIPRICHLGAVIERALQIYDTQPGALVVKKHDEPKDVKLTWGMALRALGVTLGGHALHAFIFLPVPVVWRDYRAAQLYNRLKFPMPNLVLTFPVWVICLSLHGFAVSRGKPAVIFRTGNQVKFAKAEPNRVSHRPAGSEEEGSSDYERAVVSISFVIALTVSFWLLPLPARYFSLERIEALDRLDASTAVTCAGLVLLGSLLLFLANLTGCATYVGATGPRVSLFKLNIITLVYSLFLAMVIAGVFALEADGQPWQQVFMEEEPADDWIRSDGVVEIIVSLAFPNFYCFSLFSVTTFFTFLYRCELSRHAPDERRAETLTSNYIRWALAPDVGEAISKVASAVPVSFDIVARRGVPLAFWQVSATYWTYVVYLGAHLLAAYLQFRPGWTAFGLSTWTKEEGFMPLINFFPALVVPFLCIIACILTRHNDVKLWSYREDWKPEPGQSQLEAGGVTVASEEGEKEDEALLQKDLAEAQPKISQEHEAVLMAARSRQS